MSIQTFVNSAPDAAKKAALSPKTVRRSLQAPLSLRLVAISLILPEGLSFFIFDLRFTVTRLLFILLTPLLVHRLSQKISTGRYHFLLTDLFVILSGLWFILASTVVEGLAASLNHAGPIVLEFCAGYFVTRVLLSEHGEALAFMSLFCNLLAIAGLLALLDVFTGRYFTADLAQSLTGYVKPGNFTPDFRLGLIRARGPFEHPIVLGMLSAIALLVSSSVSIKWKKFSIIGSAIGTIISFSTAPYQSLLMGFGLLTYNRFFSGLSYRWIAITAVFASMLGAVWLSGYSILSLVFNHLMLDSGSGWWRLWTWTVATPMIDQAPWFGWGFRDVPNVTQSVDALWLVLALTFGKPGADLLYLTLIAGAALPVSSPRLNLLPMERKLGITLGIVMSMLIFMSFTIDFWGSSWIACALLLGVKAHIAELGRIRSAPAP